MYQVLYRKWRPKVFADVVGQPHITSTLKNEIMNSRHSHAYLFTGSRGTGKTTCAKILAKAVNCLHPVDGDPCGECDVCKGIESGAIMDVIEIDAASNNGVDNIRDIRQEANFSPASCKYRVYIIDEVHMLSAGAFNALLKTLEEPPEHVKFILATTEVHKLPATILSRCQRFDFRRIPSEDMVERMMYISAQENMELDEDAAYLIARISDGGMRDALSLLDQCFGTGERVTSDVVSRVAGLTGKGYLFDLADALCGDDCARSMAILDDLHNSSCDMERLCSELVNHYRSLMVIKTVKSAENVLVCTKEEFLRTEEQSKKFTLEKIIYTIDLLQDTLSNMKKGVNKRTEMEMAVIRLSTPSLDTSKEALLRRIAALESALRSGAAVTQTAPPPKTPTVSEKGEEPEAPSPSKSEEPAPEKPVERDTAPAGEAPAQTQESRNREEGESVRFMQWAEVVDEIRKTNMPLWGVLSDSQAYIRDDFVLVDCMYPTFSQLIRQGSNAGDVKKAIMAITGKRYRLGIFRHADNTVKQEEKADPLSNLVDKMRKADIKVDIKE